MPSGVDTLAREFWGELASGDVDKSRLAPKFARLLTPAMLSQVQSEMASFGELRSFVSAGKSEASGLTIYRYSLTFANGMEHPWSIVIDEKGRVAGSRLLR